MEQERSTSNQSVLRKMIKDLGLKRERDEENLYRVQDYLEDFEGEDPEYLEVMLTEVAKALGQSDEYGIHISEDQAERIIKYLSRRRSTSEARPNITSDAESVLSAVETFTIPDVSQIQKYVELFDVVLRKQDISDVFEIVKRIDQKSANGIIYVVKMRNAKPEYKHNKLLIKVQRSQYSDPPSYEYYVGRALNTLRGMNVSNFALVYGRFRCGYNESGRTLCDPRHQKRTHVLYEYITSLSGKTITLSEYIDSKIDDTRKTINVINILIMLMISLQKAQDHLSFTHYDLHLGNVLLVELNASYSFAYEYKGKTYTIVLDYFPFIIDYGRSYVDPEKVDKIVKEPIVDLDSSVKYPDFATYQSEIWEDTTLGSDDDIPTDFIESKLRNPDILKELQKILGRQEITVDDVIGLFYTVEYEEGDPKQTTWLIPDTPNPYYDHHKLLMHVCVKMWHKGLGKFVFDGLRERLYATFPFYDPGSYGVGLSYDHFKFSGTMRRPIDAAKWLWGLVKDDVKQTPVTSKDLSFSQLGGSDTKKYYRRVANKIRVRK